MRTPPTSRAPSNTRPSGLLCLVVRAFFGASLLSACTPSPSSEATTAPSPAAQASSGTLSSARHHTLQISLAGQALGTMSTRIHVLEDGGFEVEEHIHFDMQRQSGAAIDHFQSETLYRTIYGPDFAGRSWEKREREGGIESEEVGRADTDGIVVRRRGPGYDEEARYPYPEGYRDSMQVFRSLCQEIEREGKESATARYLSFNRSEQRFETETLTVSRATPESGQRESEKSRWSVALRSDDGSVTEGVVDAYMVPFRLTLQESIVIERTGPGEATKRSPSPNSSTALLSSELVVQGVLPRDEAHPHVRVKVDHDDSHAPSIFPDSLYHQGERGNGIYHLTLSSPALPPNVASLTSPLRDLPISFAPYLEATEQNQSDHPEIQRIADSLRADDHSALRSAQRVVTWVYKALAKRSGMRGSASALEALRQKAGDCTEHAALSVALLRALGIPARTANGIVIATPSSGHSIAAYHAWTEIWLGQWVIADATTGELAPPPRYLFFGYDEPGEKSASTAILRTLGKTKIEVERSSQ